MFRGRFHGEYLPSKQHRHGHVSSEICGPIHGSCLTLFRLKWHYFSWPSLWRTRRPTEADGPFKFLLLLASFSLEITSVRMEAWSRHNMNRPLVRLIGSLDIIYVCVCVFLKLCCMFAIFYFLTCIFDLCMHVLDSLTSPASIQTSCQQFSKILHLFRPLLDTFTKTKSKSWLFMFLFTRKLCP